MNRLKEWKNSLLTLPDSVFFNLMRNYLGTLETPFNKHEITERLNIFLRNKTNLKAIADELDGMDRKILSIVYLLDGTPEAPLIDLMRDTSSSWEIRQKLTNLQERLLLYKGKHDLYYPVPQTEKYLKTGIVTPGELFPEIKRNEGEDPLPWLNDSFLTAFLSFLIHNPLMIKTDGSLAKKGISEITSAFPIFAASPEKAEFLIEILIAKGMLRVTEEKQLDPSPVPWLQTASEEWYPRVTGMRADFAVFNRDLSFPWKSRDGEEIITGLINSFPEEYLFPREAVYRILFLLLTEKRPPLEDLKHITDRLILLGILIEEEEGLGICRGLKNEESLLRESGILTVHPNHEFTLMPGVSFGRVYPIAWYTRLVSYDTVGTYILDQNSFFKGLHMGENLPPLGELLEKISETSIPQNIAFSLSSWLEQFRSVRLIEGIVLKVSESRIPFIENNPLLKPFIREVLAPGVYIMDQAEKDLWEKSLLNTGITALPPVEHVSQIGEEEKASGRRIKKGRTIDLLSGAHPEERETLNPSEMEKNQENPGSGEDELLQILGRLNLPEAEKEELEERIRKKVIILPSQLKPGIAQREMREARGLDYNGKIRLIDTSVSSGHEYLEISWFTPEDELKTDNIIPRHLAKEENDLILSGPLLSDPGGTAFRIRVRKISYLKRKKLSFFGL